jgi:ABC-type phosphate transport system substrate-binding protein
MAAFQAKYPEADFSLSSVGSGAAQSALWGSIDCAKKPVEALCGGTSTVNMTSTVWGIGGGSFDADDYTDHEDLGLQQLPSLGGPVVLMYSKDVVGLLGVAGDAGLNMTLGVVAGLFNGTINWWDAPALQALNPRVTLPHEKVTVLVREVRWREVDRWRRIMCLVCVCCAVGVYCGRVVAGSS